MPEIRVGMSGWTHAPWRGDFYPEKLSQKRELEYASRQVTSIEVNGTFYSLQKPQTFQNWFNQTPDNFVFSIKAPQFITHVLRLKECEQPLSTFLASGLFCLKRKLGPILWQFPPNVMLKDDRFEKFIKLLPRTSFDAAARSKQHSPKINGRAVTEVSENFPLRHAFEFRHPSFHHPDFVAMMKEYKIAIVVADSGKKSPYMEEVTSDFMYIRMHGENPAFKKGYTRSALKKMCDRIQKWSSGEQVKDAKTVLPGLIYPGPKNIYIYFDTGEKIYAPHDAIRMIKLLENQKTIEDLQSVA